jgi:hypothetical protein
MWHSPEFLGALCDAVVGTSIAVALINLVNLLWQAGDDDD